MRLQALAESPLILRARTLRGDFDLAGLSSDSRRLGGGMGFFALQGEREDGHAYLEAALAGGAPVLFVSDPAAFERIGREPPPGLAGMYQVAPGRRVLADLAALIYGAPSHALTLLGLTGTNGKTTASHLVRQLYQARGVPCGVIGSLGALLHGAWVEEERTTPEAPVVQGFLRRCIAEGASHAAMEATSIGIMLERTRNLRFGAAAFTNLTQDHLDFHGTLAEYEAAKLRLFLDHETGAAVIGRDDPVGRTFAGRIRAARPAMPLLTYGLEGGADLFMEEVRSGAEGSSGIVCHRGERLPFRTSLLGRFNLSNLLAAVGLLLAVGEPLAATVEAIAACEGVPGRFEQFPQPGGFMVVVDYAHTPHALENALATARALTAGRLVVVFGCGGERDTGKRQLMGAAAEALADEVILTNDNPRGEEPERIVADIRKGMGRGPAATLLDRKAAIWEAMGRAERGDIVLVAGKGHERYQEIGGRKEPFSDREAVLAWPGGGARAARV